ncbi:MAG: alpha/beta hydrolase [Myxococcota bacterium]
MRFDDLYLRRGDKLVHVRLYDVATPEAGVIFVGGVHGGFSSPAGGLYGQLAEALAARDVLCIHLRFRHSTDLVESVRDVGVALGYLEDRKVPWIGLVGHAFGAAVMVRAAVGMERVRAVVALAPQSHGSEAVGTLGPRARLLVVHGLEDEVLPPRCATHLHERATPPKRLLLFPGAGHELLEVTEQVRDAVLHWLEAAHES